VLSVDGTFRGQGMRVRPDGPQLISELVRKSVGADCSVLMGANIAQDIGAGQLSEATIGRAPVIPCRPGPPHSSTCGRFKFLVFPKSVLLSRPHAWTMAA